MYAILYIQRRDTSQPQKTMENQITKLVNTYCEMHGWAAEEALTECLTKLVEIKGTTVDAIEKLNTVNDEYMEEV